MGHLYLVRHGQTQWNSQGIMQGRQDSPLTPQGIEQAKNLGVWMKDLSLDHIFSSSSGRATETCALLLADRNLPVETMDELREVALGPWEGQLKETIQERWPGEVAQYWKDPAKFIPLPGMESFPELEHRCRSALSHILTGRKGETLLVVSHGVTSAMLLCVLEGRPWWDVFQGPFKSQTSVTLVDFTPEQPQILYRGKTDHLIGIKTTTPFLA